MKPLIYLSLLALPVLGMADDIRLQRDDVIPVVMRTELNFKNTREGDRFKADVTDSRMLPWGTRVEGVVDRIERRRGDRPASMEIEFTTIILPDGQRIKFHGTPIALNKNNVTRDRDGRWEAKKGVKKETVVLGATAGGLIVGTIIGRKPFEGAMVGALLGILAAETDKDHVADGNVVIPKGSKVGARVDDDLTIAYDGRWDNTGRNDGGYDRDGYDRDGYDRYGYDRDGYRSRDLRIEIDRRTLSFRAGEQPYRKDWIVMVPLESTADQLGYQFDRDRDNGFRLWNEDDEITLEQGSRSYRLNGGRGSLPAEVEVRNGTPFVPIDVFTKLAKGSVTVNGTKYRPQA